MTSEFHQRLHNESLDASTDDELPIEENGHGNDFEQESRNGEQLRDQRSIGTSPVSPSTSHIIPAFAGPGELTNSDLRSRMGDAITAFHS